MPDTKETANKPYETVNETDTSDTTTDAEAFEDAAAQLASQENKGAAPVNENIVQEGILSSDEEQIEEAAAVEEVAEVPV